MRQTGTRPSAATLRAGEAETAALTGGPISKFNFTTAAPAGQGQIAPLLGVGQSAALTIKDLCRITGWNNRTVRLTIQRERLAGQPICSDNANGYYLPADNAERVACVRSLRHRASEINRVAAALERARL